MYRYFIRTDIREKLYNCSGRSYNEWKALGHPNFPLGMLYTASGIIFFITYFPFIVVFCKSNLTKQSCYKIMFYIGIIDTIQMPMGIATGYFATTGIVFCMAPATQYAFGSIGLGIWITGTTASMLLALNRCLDVINLNIANKLFHGNKIFFWLSIPVIYGSLVAFFYPAMIFSSRFGCYFLDPFMDIPDKSGAIGSANLLLAHNCVVVIWLSVTYSCVFIVISYRARSLDYVRMTQIQRQTFLSALMICTGTFVCALSVVMLELISLPLWVGILAEYGWQVSHGMVGINYWLLNKTMRTEAVCIFLGECITESHEKLVAMSTRISAYIPKRGNNTLSS